MTTQPLPLAGIRVVDYSHFLAGPFVSRCLAALGAEVIKVERPKEGDAGRAHAYQINGQSGYYLQQNMGKEGLCVNIKDPRGLELVKKLVDSADVFVENYRPGALSKLGLGYEELAKTNPGLVYCSVSAYGHTGPDAPRPGFGLIAEAKSGIMAMVGSPGEAPPLLRIALGDMYTGANAVGAICAALLGRVKSGRGQHIDLALYDCLVSMHEYAIQCYTLSGGKDIPQQSGHDLPNSTLYGVFTAKDGYVVIAAQVDDAWKRLATLIGGEALAGWLQELVEGTAELPLEQGLRRVGLKLAWEPASPAPGIGVRTVAEGEALKIANVFDGGAAQAAGLSAGDVLVAIDGLKATAGSFDKLLARRLAGDSAEIHVFRRDELMRFEVELRAPLADTARLAVDPDAGPTAIALREAWLA